MNENFRYIRNLLIRIVLLAALFAACVIGFSRMINKVTPDTAQEMEEATFPLVCMQKDGVDFNLLHGYSREVDASGLRDSITPLSDDRQITMKIETFGTAVDSVSYEVSTIDGTKELENTKVIKLEQDGDTMTADLTLMDKLLMNKEYVLRIQVTTGGRNIFYYTHVVLADGLHTSDYLNFAAGFWDKCINKTDLDSVGQAIEPDDTTDQDDTLAYMDIHDSVNRLTWGDLDPQIFYKPTPRLTEINANTATMTMDYRISSTAGSGAVELYNVHEYYRLRYTDSRVYLLNFERTTDQIFDPESGDALSEEGINLGITQKQLEYKADSRNRCIAFVQENVLWTYMTRKGAFTRVFGFPQTTDMDARDFYDQNTIRIIRVDESGDVTFAVGGYMNRGNHEGDNGIALYYYDAGSNMVSELAFLQSDENTERIRLDMQDCLYLTQNGRKCCVYLEGVLYSADISTGEVSVLQSGIQNECYSGSESGRYFAWLKEGQLYGSTAIEEIDLETGNITGFRGGQDEYLLPLTFMKEDLVYGAARAGDVQVPHGGCGTFPMYKLQIVQADGTVIKTYQPDGLYVKSVSKTGNMLTLLRVKKEGGSYAEAAGDQIVSSDTSEDVELGISTRVDDRKLTVVLLRVGSTISFDSPESAESKLVTGTSKKIPMPGNPDPQDLFYVYASGGLTAMYTYPNDAIVEADRLFGVVVNQAQDYVWVRGDKVDQTEIPMKDIPEAVKSGATDPAQLKIGIGRQIVDLSGCTLDEVLYFVSHGRPVIAQTKDGVKIIVGYDEYNTYLMNPGDTEWEYYGMQDSTDLFSESGNVFLSYLDTAA